MQNGDVNTHAAAKLLSHILLKTALLHFTHLLTERSFAEKNEKQAVWLDPH